MIPLLSLLEGPVSLACLDAASGKLLWRKPLDVSECEHVLFGSLADGKYVLTGSRNGKHHPWYLLYAFDVLTGEAAWRNKHANVHAGVIGNNHGEQIHHPVIAGDVVFAEPCACDLHSGVRVNPQGEPAEWTMPERRGMRYARRFLRDAAVPRWEPGAVELRPGGGASAGQRGFADGVLDQLHSRGWSLAAAGGQFGL